MTKLEYQLDVLKLEIETINSAIRQMDLMTEKIKNWTILIWAGATGAAISEPNLNRYIALTAAIPLAFWFVDAWYRRIQRRFIWRTNQISEFLNDGRLKESFDKQEITGFRLFDPGARNSKGRADYERFISVRHVLGFGSLSLFYIFLIVLSLVAWSLVRLAR